ncbi:hypothetical protein SESBI_32655 [Sesbania bispinosa]|nr:hypothetical protein SESBI_32655 [Sesbania bispinosa]
MKDLAGREGGSDVGSSQCLIDLDMNLLPGSGDELSDLVAIKWRERFSALVNPGSNPVLRPNKKDWCASRRFLMRWITG